MHYCDHALSVRPSLTFHIFHFSSETTEQNSTKLDWKQDLNVLYQVCVFRADRKKQYGRPGLWLAETFSTSPLKLLNRIQPNLTESKNSTSFTKSVFFVQIGKTRWPPWPLIGWDIFNFSSETTEQNSTKFDWKQNLNVLYQVCVFRADQKNKMAALASDWLRHFRLLLWTRWKQDFNILYQVLCFLWPIGKTRWPHWPLIAWLRHFRLLLWNCWTEFNKSWQEARCHSPLPSLCFLRRSKKEDGHPGLQLAETFSTSPLKPLNWIKRNLTGSKISMSSTNFVFFGPISKQKWWQIVLRCTICGPLGLLFILINDKAKFLKTLDAVKMSTLALCCYYLQWCYISFIEPCKHFLESIIDEHSQQVVFELGKSHAQWFTSNKVRCACKYWDNWIYNSSRRIL